MILQKVSQSEIAFHDWVLISPKGEQWATGNNDEKRKKKYHPLFSFIVCFVWMVLGRVDRLIVVFYFGMREG